jgi:hypothetical protein
MHILGGGRGEGGGGRESNCILGGILGGGKGRPVTSGQQVWNKQCELLEQSCNIQTCCKPVTTCQQALWPDINLLQQSCNMQICCKPVTTCQQALWLDINLLQQSCNMQICCSSVTTCQQQSCNIQTCCRPVTTCQQALWLDINLLQQSCNMQICCKLVRDFTSDLLLNFPTQRVTSNEIISNNTTCTLSYYSKIFFKCIFTWPVIPRHSSEFMIENILPFGPNHG